MVLSVMLPGSIDPVVRWALSSLRLWYGVMQSPCKDEDVDQVAALSKGRLGAVAKMVGEWGITVSTRGFYLDGELPTATNTWSVCRKSLILFIKKKMAMSLAVRRPVLFEGLQGHNEKHHAQFLRSLSHYDAACMLKIWSGAVMWWIQACADLWGHGRMSLWRTSPDLGAHALGLPLLCSSPLCH